MYVYNKLTKATRWLRTVEGAKVHTSVGYQVQDIDDPNPTNADSSGPPPDKKPDDEADTTTTPTPIEQK